MNGDVVVGDGESVCEGETTATTMKEREERERRWGWELGGRGDEGVRRDASYLRCLSVPSLYLFSLNPNPIQHERHGTLRTVRASSQTDSGLIGLGMRCAGWEIDRGRSLRREGDRASE